MTELYDNDQANDYLDEIDDNISNIKNLVHKLDNLNISQEIQGRYANTMTDLFDYLRSL